MTRYANDYIGQLCRSRKIDGRMIGRVWYVNRESILAYQKASDANYHQNNELPPVEHVMPIVPVASVPTPVEGVATIIPIAAPVAPIVAPSGMTYGADTRPLLPELIKGSIEEVPAAPIVEIQKKNIFGSSIAQAKTIASGTGARLFATLFVSLLVGYSAAFALSNYQPAVSAYGNISDAVASYT